MSGIHSFPETKGLTRKTEYRDFVFLELLCF